MPETASTPPNPTPASAWSELSDGNRRFVDGAPIHPHQGGDRIAELSSGQAPTVALFGCSDSRVAAEIIFDQGLGDMFVVRTAGHAIDSSVIGSLEYAVAVLGVPLIAVLGHDSCGAVSATVSSLDSGQMPPGFIRDVVERITPSVLAGRREGLTEVDQFVAHHVIEAAKQLVDRSQIIADAVKQGELGIVGLTYQLAEGKVHLRGAVGDLGDLGDVAIEPLVESPVA